MKINQITPKNKAGNRASKVYMLQATVSPDIHHWFRVEAAKRDMNLAEFLRSVIERLYEENTTLQGRAITQEEFEKLGPAVLVENRTVNYGEKS